MDVFNTFEPWLFLFNLKHPSNILAINPSEALYLVIFLSSSWFFTVGNIKCQENYHAIIQSIF